MLLGGLRRVLRGRRRGQGLVEYGLITACLAFVGLAGFNALANSEKDYLATFPTNAVPPAAPGSLLHPTSIDPLPCAYASISDGDTYTCSGTFTVRDIFFNPADRNPPWGRIELHVDNDPIPIGSCSPAMPNSTNGSLNSCAITGSWTPSGLGSLGLHSLVACYGRDPAAGAPCSAAQPVQSNHLASVSLHVTIAVQAKLNFGVPNPNLNPFPSSPSPLPNPSPVTKCFDPPTLTTGTVEEGHPLTCVATLWDSTNSRWATGTQVDWTTDATPGIGIGLFACATYGKQPSFLNTMWNAAACTPASTMSCTINPQGYCAVIYRRLNGVMTDGAAGAHTVFVQPRGYPISSGLPIPVNVSTINFQHLSDSWQVCKPQVPGPSISMTYSISHAVRSATFPVTNTIDITGGSAGVSCTVFVIDTGGSGNTALDCVGPPAPSCLPGALNPDLHEAHPPRGTVTWDWPGRAIPKPTCDLIRLDVMSVQVPAQPPYVVQPPGQTAYSSSCTTTFTLSGAAGTLDVDLKATYTDRTHQDATGPEVDVNFN